MRIEARALSNTVGQWALCVLPAAVCFCFGGDLAIVATVLLLGMAQLAWSAARFRVGERPDTHETRDLGLEVLEAICALPRPTGDDPHAADPETDAETDAETASGDYAHERTRLILDGMNEGVIVIGGGGNLRLTNSAARRILDLDHARTGWQPFLEYLESDLKECIVRGVTSVRSGLRRYHEVKAIRAGNGVYDLTFLRLPHPPTGGVAVLITDRSHIHEMSRVADEFLSCISHELRTPLTSICAAIEILQQMHAQADGESGEFMQVIELESKRLTRIVDDVLDFSTLEASDEAWEVQPVHVVDVLHTVRAETHDEIAVRGLVVEIRAEGKNLVCLAEHRRLRQVVEKLVDNAIKFSPIAGRIRLTARRSQGRIKVVVEDMGDGIDRKDREAVFHRFRQIGDALTEKPAGTGLGLAACRRILSRMHGHIWCDDSPLGGARFSFTLPEAEPSRRPGRETLAALPAVPPIDHAEPVQNRDG